MLSLPKVYHIEIELQESDVSKEHPDGEDMEQEDGPLATTEKADMLLRLMGYYKVNQLCGNNLLVVGENCDLHLLSERHGHNKQITEEDWS